LCLIRNYGKDGDTKCSLPEWQTGCRRCRHEWGWCSWSLNARPLVKCSLESSRAHSVLFKPLKLFVNV
jgi:hypothetical protein